MTMLANTNAIPNSSESAPFSMNVSASMDATKAECDEGMPE